MYDCHLWPRSALGSKKVPSSVFASLQIPPALQSRAKSFYDFPEYKTQKSDRWSALRKVLGRSSNTHEVFWNWLMQPNPGSSTTASSINCRQVFPLTGNGYVAAKTGSIYISGTVTDRIVIPTVNLRFSTTPSSRKNCRRAIATTGV